MHLNTKQPKPCDTVSAMQVVCYLVANYKNTYLFECKNKDHEFLEANLGCLHSFCLHFMAVYLYSL